MKYRTIGHLIPRIAAAGALTCGVAGAGVSAFVAGAGPAYAAGTTLYVGASAGRDTGCTSPGYTSVQAAVNAASSGDTVYLCGTTPFDGQVIITKSITLTGAKGATIAAPATWTASADALPPQFTSDGLLAPQVLVFAWGQGVHVTIRGLDINGPLPGTGGCASEEYGILVLSGASAQITGDAVTNIEDANNALYGCQFGVGIEIGAQQWPTPGYATFKTENFTGSATITGTTVSGYQKNGITVDGPGSSALVSEDTITGSGPTGLGQIIAQNGIQISDGAAGQVERNTVSGNQYSSSVGLTYATGVEVFGGCGGPLVKNLVVADNTFINNDVGVQLYNSDPDNDPNCTVPSSARTNDEVAANRISDSAVTNTSGDPNSSVCGYQAGVSDFGNHDVIIENDISGAGYANHPTCTTAQPYVTYKVDTTGSIDPLVLFNS